MRGRPDDDPLDAAGLLGANPLTGRPYSEARMKWAKKWRAFPLYADKPKLRELVSSIRDNQVTVVVSGTGSGKTVLAVPLVLRHVLSNDRAPAGSQAPGPKRRVAVTIPKRILAQSAAVTGAMTLDVEVGQEVGFQHRGSPSSAFSAERTRLVYATDGTLLAQARKDPMLLDYAAVVVDEAHERPVPTDFLLLAIRGALVARPDLRLVVMSATIDPKPFVDYFSSAAIVSRVVEIAGAANFPIDVRHEPPASPSALVSDPLAVGLAAVARIEAASPPPTRLGVLLFVPTTRDATGGCRAPKPPRPASASMSCAPLYGKMSDDAKDAVLGDRARRERPPRMLFVATNVAESSLTVEGVTHVVDTGLQLTNRWDAAAHGSIIDRGMASRAQITQRIGRTGRTAPGVAVLLYPRSVFDALPLYPPPAILSVDLTEHAMAALARRPTTLADVFAELGSLITPPTRAQLDGAASFMAFYGIVETPPLPPHPGQPLPLPPRQPGQPRTQEPVGGGRRRRRPEPGKPEHTTFERSTITPFGRWVQRACEELKLSVWHALLPCVAAAAYRHCARDLVDLALVFESCGGELGTLIYVSPDRGGPDRGTHDAIKEHLDSASDHRSVIRVLRDFVRPLMDGENGNENANAKAKGSASTRRRATNDALMRAGLQPSAWRAAVDRLRRDGGRAMRFVGHAAAELSPASLPRHLLLAASPTEERDAFVSAIAAARMYHLVGGPQAKTVFPARRVAVAVESMFGKRAAARAGAFSVCEQLTSTSGSWRTSCVTFFSGVGALRAHPRPKA